MNDNKRPLPVTLVAYLYLVVGIGGFIYHFDSLKTIGPSNYDGVWIELTELLAALAGAFLLRGRNWARWLALAWMGFHVFLSLSAFRELGVHLLFFVVIAGSLFRGEAPRYFRADRAD